MTDDQKNKFKDLNLMLGFDRIFYVAWAFFAVILYLSAPSLWEYFVVAVIAPFAVHRSIHWIVKGFLKK